MSYEATTRGLIIRGPAAKIAIAKSKRRTFKLQLDCRLYRDGVLEKANDRVTIYLVENDSPTSNWDIAEDLLFPRTVVTREVLGRVFSNELTDHAVGSSVGHKASNTEYRAFKVPWNLPFSYLD